MKNIIERLNKIDLIIANNDFAKMKAYNFLALSPVERQYLFNSLKEKFSEEWFLHLFKIDAFNPINIPGPKAEIQSDGTITNWFYGWDASFLLKIATEKNDISYNELLTSVILKIINGYISYVSNILNNPDRNQRPDWIISDCILLLPLSYISNEHISFIKNVGLRSRMTHIEMELTTSFFDKVIKEKNKSMTYTLLEIFYSPLENNHQKFELNSTIDNYALLEFANKSSPQLISLLGDEVIKWLISKIKALNANYPDAFAKFNIVSIEEDLQNWGSQGLNHIIVKQLRNCFKDINKENKTVYTFGSLLLKDSAPILKRIGFYLANMYYSQLREQLWSLHNPLNDSECKLEVYKLLKNHSNEFTITELDLLNKWIDEIDINTNSTETKDQFDKYLAYKKLEWYLALQNNSVNNNLINKKISDLSKIADTIPSHPGYDSWSEIKIGGDYSTKRIINEDLKLISNRLNNKKEWMGYDEWGLREDLRYVVTNRTGEILEDDTFLNEIPIRFLYYAIDGIRNSLSTDKRINWDLLLQYFNNLINNDKLWEDQNKDENESIIGMICWTLREAITKGLFDNYLQLQDCCGIFIKLDNAFIKPFVYINSDHATDVFDSTRGKLYEAMIIVSLRIAKITDNTNINKWETSIKNVFEKRISDKSFYQEMYWTLGFYTPQISYLDHNWWVRNKQFIYINNSIIKNISFKGYLLRADKVYANVYRNLKHEYSKALFDFEEKTIYSDRLVEHIFIAYLNDFEGSKILYESIFKQKKIFLLHHIIECLVTKNITAKNDSDILKIWGRVNLILKTINTSEASELIFFSIELIEVIKTLNLKILKLFKDGLECFHTTPKIYRIIDRIIDLLDSNPAIAGIMLKLLLKHIQGDYSYGREKVIYALQKLYSVGEKNSANTIALHFAEQGNYYVKNIYNKYNDLNQVKKKSNSVHIRKLYSINNEPGPLNQIAKKAISLISKDHTYEEICNIFNPRIINPWRPNFKAILKQDDLHNLSENYKKRYFINFPILSKDKIPFFVTTQWATFHRKKSGEIIEGSFINLIKVLNNLGVHIKETVL